MIKLVDVYSVPDPLHFLYGLLLERPKEANISHKVMPWFPEHVRFVDSKPYSAWYLIVTNKGERVGSIYLTRQNEVGIAIAERHRGKGYGAAALGEIRKLHSGRLLANVAPGNYASHEFFKAMGWHVIQYTYELPEEQEHGEEESGRVGQVGEASER